MLILTMTESKSSVKAVLKVLYILAMKLKKRYLRIWRKELNPKEGHENALFLSSVGKRLCVRSVELLVKKYASTVTTVKHITPHKLRSTYGTNLYQESKDIYLVADVLGHKDVNTTRRHYAEIVDENKRNARNIVHLRRD